MKTFRYNIIDKITETNDFRIRFTLVAIFLTMFVCIPFFFIYIIVQAYEAVILISLMFAAYITAVFLIKNNYMLMARIWFFSFLTAHMFLITYMFSALSGFHYYFIVIPALTGIIFNISDKKERILSIAFVIIPILFFIGFSFYEITPRINLDAVWFNFFNHSSVVFTMIMLFTGFNIFAKEITMANKNLVKLATTDPMTGIINRREFINRADREINVHNRYKSPLSFIMIDIDYFKKINDIHGHETGDVVLKEFTQIGKECVRETDHFSRLGGEEFAILLIKSDKPLALQIAERLRKKIEDTVFTIGVVEIKITISIGLAFLTKSENTIDLLMSKADEALYRAKKQGRNRVEY